MDPLEKATQAVDIMQVERRMYFEANNCISKCTGCLCQSWKAVGVRIQDVLELLAS